jgi:hypothetical protein
MKYSEKSENNIKNPNIYELQNYAKYGWRF